MVAGKAAKVVEVGFLECKLLVEELILTAASGGEGMALVLNKMGCPGKEW